MGAEFNSPDSGIRIETDSLGEVHVPEGKLWGAQTQRALEHFSIGADRMPREVITAYAILKKAAATANHAAGVLDDERRGLIVQAYASSGGSFHGSSSTPASMLRPQRLASTE